MFLFHPTLRRAQLSTDTQQETNLAVVNRQFLRKDRPSVTDAIAVVDHPAVDATLSSKTAPPKNPPSPGAVLGCLDERLYEKPSPGGAWSCLLRGKGRR
jgi:hypothetical protein